MRRRNWAPIALVLAALPGLAAAQSRPDQLAFRELYRELVETNTTFSSGSCTRAAAQIAARLKTAGFPDRDVIPFSVPDHSREGGLVAVLPGSDRAAKAILLLAHLDVVEAKREDWTRDPFKLVEENGFFYARGSTDDKAMAAIWADAMIRFRRQGYAPKRTIKLALTCGEETGAAWNGAEWLAKNRRDLIDAAFALNEGGGGRNRADGSPEVLAVQVGEKASQNFTLTATNPGGHSSLPRTDNAIYELADALEAIRAYAFPVRLNDTTRAFFRATARTLPPAGAQAVTALLANPADGRADAILSQDAMLRATLRTTCVATLRRLAGAKVTVTAVQPIRPLAVPPTLDPAVLGPMQAVAAKHFPGVPMVPLLSTGATDGIFLEAVGIPTYGVPGLVLEPDLNGMHGLNERMRVSSLYAGRDYLFDLIKAYAG